jgi:hypothetical protein
LPYTFSTDAPTTDGAHDRTYNGGADYYLAKLSSDGQNLAHLSQFNRADMAALN